MAPYNVTLWYQLPPRILTVPGWNRSVHAGASTLCEVGNSSLKLDDADKGYTGGPKEMEQLC